MGWAVLSSAALEYRGQQNFFFVELLITDCGMIFFVLLDL
jgi:hypothetical protein